MKKDIWFFKQCETLLNISYTSLWAMDELLKTRAITLYQTGQTIKEIISIYEDLKKTSAYQIDTNVKNQVDSALELCNIQLLTDRLNTLNELTDAE